MQIARQTSVCTEGSDRSLAEHTFVQVRLTTRLTVCIISHKEYTDNTYRGLTAMFAALSIEVFIHRVWACNLESDETTL